MNKSEIILQTVAQYPAVIPQLRGAARAIVFDALKTYDYYLTTLTRLVRSVYSGLLGGEFQDILLNLVQGQTIQAFEQAWIDDGNFLPIPESMQAAADTLALGQVDYINGYFRDIITARLDGTSIDPLIARAQLWANRYNEAYNQARAQIALEMGGKLEWQLGATEEHCETCGALNGKVDYASEWDRAGLHPQGAPNGKLECGGWRCDCSLLPTDKRRSPGGIAKLGY